MLFFVTEEPQYGVTLPQIVPEVTTQAPTEAPTEATTVHVPLEDFTMGEETEAPTQAPTEAPTSRKLLFKSNKLIGLRFNI